MIIPMLSPMFIIVARSKTMIKVRFILDSHLRVSHEFARWYRWSICCNYSYYLSASTVIQLLWHTWILGCNYCITIIETRYDVCIVYIICTVKCEGLFFTYSIGYLGVQSRTAGLMIVHMIRINNVSIVSSTRDTVTESVSFYVADNNDVTITDLMSHEYPVPWWLKVVAHSANGQPSQA